MKAFLLIQSHTTGNFAGNTSGDTSDMFDTLDISEMTHGIV